MRRVRPEEEDERTVIGQIRKIRRLLEADYNGLYTFIVNRIMGRPVVERGGSPQYLPGSAAEDMSFLYDLTVHIEAADLLNIEFALKQDKSRPDVSQQDKDAAMDDFWHLLAMREFLTPYDYGLIARRFDDAEEAKLTDEDRQRLNRLFPKRISNHFPCYHNFAVLRQETDYSGRPDYWKRAYLFCNVSLRLALTFYGSVMTTQTLIQRDNARTLRHPLVTEEHETKPWRQLIAEGAEWRDTPNWHPRFVHPINGFLTIYERAVTEWEWNQSVYNHWIDRDRLSVLLFDQQTVRPEFGWAPSETDDITGVWSLECRHPLSLSVAQRYRATDAFRRFQYTWSRNIDITEEQFAEHYQRHGNTGFELVRQSNKPFLHDVSLSYSITLRNAGGWTPVPTDTSTVFLPEDAAAGIVIKRVATHPGQTPPPTRSTAMDSFIVQMSPFGESEEAPTEVQRQNFTVVKSHVVLTPLPDAVGEVSFTVAPSTLPYLPKRATIYEKFSVYASMRFVAAGDIKTEESTVDGFDGDQFDRVVRNSILDPRRITQEGRWTQGDWWIPAESRSSITENRHLVLDAVDPFVWLSTLRAMMELHGSHSVTGENRWDPVIQHIMRSGACLHIWDLLSPFNENPSFLDFLFGAADELMPAAFDTMRMVMDLTEFIPGRLRRGHKQRVIFKDKTT